MTKDRNDRMLALMKDREIGCSVRTWNMLSFFIYSETEEASAHLPGTQEEMNSVRFLDNYFGKVDEKKGTVEGKNITEALKYATFRLFSINPAEIDIGSDEAISKNAYKLEEISGMISAYDMMMDEHPDFLDSLEDNEKEIITKHCEFLRTLSAFYITRAELICNEFYKTHSDKDLLSGINDTGKKDVVQQLVEEKIMQSFVLGERLLRLGSKEAGAKEGADLKEEEEKAEDLKNKSDEYDIEAEKELQKKSGEHDVEAEELQNKSDEHNVEAEDLQNNQNCKWNEEKQQLEFVVKENNEIKKLSPRELFQNSISNNPVLRNFALAPQDVQRVNKKMDSRQFRLLQECKDNDKKSIVTLLNTDEELRQLAILYDYLILYFDEGTMGEYTSFYRKILDNMIVKKMIDEKIVNLKLKSGQNDKKGQVLKADED